MKLYTEYVKAAQLVLVSTVPVTSLEHQALSDEVNDEGVVVVVLGESFERWKALRMSEAAAGVCDAKDKFPTMVYQVSSYLHRYQKHLD